MPAPSLLGPKRAVAVFAVTALPLPLHLAHRPHPHPGRHQLRAPAASHRRRHPRAERISHARFWRLVIPSATTARAAGDPSATISDFKFTPATLTIHVGDTVTWTNSGPSPHTATANDHSFDTGKLNKGASGSHTFTQAGTFSYFCKIHPFMHGTIVVLASPGASGTAGSSGSSSSAGSASKGKSASSGSGASSGATGSGGTSSGAAGSAGSGSTLPATGLDIPLTVLCGAMLIALGIALRRRIGDNPGPSPEKFR